MGFWDGKKVLITGGAGFLGSHIVDRLANCNCTVLVPRKRECDFTNYHQAEGYFKEYNPQIVIHCAAFYGGIWINQLYPGKIFYENLVMGAHLMEISRITGVEKFVGIGTACSYPGYLENYLKEDNLWDGPPHESVINYGLTKKMMAIQGWAYKKQYDFNSIHLILTNLYGPRDTFNPERSHVVSALIRKFVESKMADSLEVEVWGTGKPIREFLYVEDCAEGIVKAAELYNDQTPLNIGTGIGTSIRELAETIMDVVYFRGKIRWNIEKPDGQYKKILDVSKMKKVLSWEPETSLREGLEKTILWYQANKEQADARF